MIVAAGAGVLGSSVLGSSLFAGDWPRFRGPNGDGISPDAKSPPTEWSDTKNLKWKTELPGPGLSCPIVIGDHVYLTCWTGYGADPENIGSPEQLKRHLLSVNRKTGEIEWTTTAPATLPEDRYGGMFAENGFASHTPTGDGERVYAFFGKSGVVAYDLAGRELWRAEVGSGLDPRQWGTASSLVLHKDLLIVTAAIESNSVIALNKVTGKEVWRQQADGLAGTWSTPILVSAKDRTDLVLPVPFEVWGLNPETGKLRWYCEGIDSDSACASVVAHDDVMYLVDGRNGGSMAIKAGGEKDVSKTHVLWRGRDRGRIGTPLYADGRLYWVNDKIVTCLNAADGKQIYRSRLGGGAAPEGGRGGGGGGGGGRGGGPGGFGGGGPGGQDYSSLVASGKHMFYVARNGDSYAIELGPTYKLVGKSRFDSDETDFNSTPAISDGDLFIRSDAFLYCVGET
jgi:outer membrane protein assembly factor BamB